MIGLGYIDRVAVAVRQILAGSPELDDWADDIVRTGNLANTAGAGDREIAVGTITEEPVFAPGGEAELSLPIGLRLVWTENRRVLEDDEPSIAGLLDEIKRVLVEPANYFLQVGGGPRLVHRLHEFRAIDFQAIAAEDDEVTLSLIVVVDYRVHVNVRTWEPHP